MFWFLEMVQPNQMKIDVVKLVKYVLRPQGPAQTPIGSTIACVSGLVVSFHRKMNCNISL